MTLVAAAPKEHRVLLRVALALLALLVAALVVFGLGALLLGAVPVPRRKIHSASASARRRSRARGSAAGFSPSRHGFTGSWRAR